MEINTDPQFHKFPLLPSELRLKIWSLALDISRTIKVNLKKDIVRPGPGHRYAQSFNSPTPVPALLHTCRESRFEGLTIYKPCFTTRHSPNYIYVCFDRDVVEIADNVICYIGEEECRELQSLIVQVKDFAYFGHYNMETLMSMSALTNLRLVVDSVTGRLGWDTESEYPYLWSLTRDFEEARRLNPNWVRPTVYIVDAKTGKEVSVLAGGVWTPEED
ncbi:hypothetical protein B7463_g6378, partial [Scytalidium lignicola]